MGFKILNAEGQAIEIKELDKEAAAFWGKEVDEKWYADPTTPRKEGESQADYYRRQRTNWFDCIGYAIHNPATNWTSGWRNVANTLLSTMSTDFIGKSEDNQLPILQLRECREIDENGNEVKAWHLPDEAEINIWGTIKCYQPYFELINHWWAKGYQPVKTDD